MKPGVGACWPMNLTGAVRTAICLVLFAASTAEAQTPATNGVGSQFEIVFWQSVDTGGNLALYEEYLRKYPEGTFAGVARAKMAQLRQTAPQAIPAGPVVNVRPTPPAESPPAAPPQPEPPTQPPGSSPPQDALDEPSDEAPKITDTPPTGSADVSDRLKNLMNSVKPEQPKSVQNQVPLPQPPAPPPASNPAQALYAGQTPNGGQNPPVLPPATGGFVPAQTAPPAAQGSTYVTFAGGNDDQRKIAVGVLPPDFALPQRPMLVAVPVVNFPASFCSGDARNAFYVNVYRPSVEAATRNYDAAGGYLRELQAVYDRYKSSGSPEPQNAVAVESRAYKVISDEAFTAQSALVSAHKALMAVPINSCDAPK